MANTADLLPVSDGASPGGGRGPLRCQTQQTHHLEFPPALRGKRLLLATESLGQINGVSRTTLSLIQYLRQHSVNVFVVAPRTYRQQARSAAGHRSELRLRGYPLPYDPTLSVVYPFRLDTLYQRTFEPDLIYLASPASLGFQILLQLRQLKCPPNVLLNFQTDLSAYCEILFPSPLDRWAVLVFRSTQGFLFSHPVVRTVFYPSSGVRDYLEEAGVPAEKMVNLRRGVNTALFNPSSRDEEFRTSMAPNQEVLLLCVGRLAPEKGFEFLAHVVRRLAGRGFPFRLLIVGGNRNPAVEGDVRRLFADEKTTGRVQFLGFREGPALARIYASADIFVHCSITETFGLVVLEAMASGIPVVARDCGGPSEIVAHEESGFLVPPADMDEFVSRVETLGKDRQLRTRMGAVARRMACEATWEKINNQVAWQLAGALRENPAISPSMASWITYLRVTGGIAIITGVWCGLIITWLLVQAALVVRTRTTRLRGSLRNYRSRAIL